MSRYPRYTATLTTADTARPVSFLRSAVSFFRVRRAALTTPPLSDPVMFSPDNPSLFNSDTPRHADSLTLAISRSNQYIPATTHRKIPKYLVRKHSVPDMVSTTYMHTDGFSSDTILPRASAKTSINRINGISLQV